MHIAAQFGSCVAEKARQREAAAGAVHVFISTGTFRQHDCQHSPSTTVPLGRPSADTRAMVATAVRAVEAMYRRGVNGAKAARSWRIGDHSAGSSTRAGNSGAHRGARQQ